MAHLLFVCSGNICRSPAAQLALRQRLGESDLTVASAGLYARVGDPVDSPMAKLLALRDIDTEGFEGRALDRPTLSSTDLVLVMTTKHRKAVVQMEPAAVQRTFLLREFTRILETARLDELVEAEASHSKRLAAALAYVQLHRSPPRRPADDEIPDPYRHSMHRYRRALDMITASVDELAKVLVRDEVGAQRA